MNHSVAIVQRIVPHYRVPFFIGLQEVLAENDIRLTLYYGQEMPGSVPRGVVVDRPWAVRIRNRYFPLGGSHLVWQPCFSELGDAGLVIVEQANRLLLNSALRIRRNWTRRRLAFWGHGRNLQAQEASTWREAFKRRRVCDVDWWFAYTDLTRNYLRDCGFSAERITTVNNTIDASGLQQALDDCTPDAVSKVAAELGASGDSVGLYCGGLYGDKRIDFLLSAAALIKARLPDFHLVIIGEGPESAKVAKAAVASGWIHYLGPLYGPDRALYLKLADVMLMPGLVGLVIIDSFVAQTPLVTTDISLHSPEIAYLEPDVNGVMSVDSVTAYADAVVGALAPERLETLRAGCRASARRYTLQRMIASFAQGVASALQR